MALHAHHHDHGHDHGHLNHGRAPADFSRAFAIGVVLNSAFVVVEATYGFLANSLALLADAGHNLGDVFGLAAAWAAALLTKRQPSARFCCGLGRTSVLAALGNAVALLLIAGGIALVQPDSARGRTANLVEQSLAVPGK
jgi:cobalt-zinc-cadmium efflux system protein